MNSFDFILSLISPRRIAMLKYLYEERHPNDIAEKFAISRQAVDKHLANLYLAGLVEKRIKEGKRPMVCYTISDAGLRFAENIEDTVENYMLEIRKNIEERIKELDRELVYGNIGEREYRALRKKLEARYSWLKW